MKPNKTEKRDRWTILEIEEKAIKVIKNFAKRNGYTVGKSVSELVYKAERVKKDEA